MLTLLKLLQAYLTPLKRVAVVALIAGNVGSGLYIWRQKIALKQSEIIYSHPQTKILYHRSVERGPTEYVTRTIEKPGGERIVERMIYRESVKENVDLSSSSMVIPLAQALSTDSKKRLVSLSLKDGSPTKIKNYIFWGGVTIKDVILKAGYQRDDGNHVWADVGVRF